MTAEPHVMLCVGLAGHVLGPGSGSSPTGQYLKSYDPEAHDGRGWAEWTVDLDEARRFDSSIEIFECWKQVPKARPVRDDGRPNRPLTAFSITPLTVEQAEAGEYL